MKSMPRVEIAHLPTPIDILPRLSEELGGPKLFVKRDDQTGLAFGGNKTRKLEFLIADAQINSARTLITAGAFQSNHCRQTAAAAARFGFECILVLYPAGGISSQLQSAPSANLLLDGLFGAEIVITERDKREETLHQTFQTASDSGRHPYMIPYGGSNTIGAYSYVLALQEFMTQFKDADWIVFPSSSGGTQAGLSLGARLLGYTGRILGISVDEPADRLKERASQLATQTSHLMGEKAVIQADEVMVNDDYLGGGYGVIGKPEIEAVDIFARLEGLLLDPVYTGRAAAGMIDLIRKGFFIPGEQVVFWHTGGTPVLFADQYRDLLSKRGSYRNPITS